MFSYIDGADYDFANREQAREAASWLARLHRAAESMADGPPLGLDTIPDVRRWWTHGDQEVAGLDEFFRRRDVREELAFVRSWQRMLVQELPLRALDALPHVWLHGDYHGRNIVFRGSRLAAVFDFDVVHRGCRAEDVAYGLFAFARDRIGSERIRPDVARFFVAEYDLVSALSEQEIEALPTMLVAVHARTAPRYALRERLGEDPAQAFKQHVRVMRSLRGIAQSVSWPYRREA